MAASLGFWITTLSWNKCTTRSVEGDGVPQHLEGAWKVTFTKGFALGMNQRTLSIWHTFEFIHLPLLRVYYYSFNSFRLYSIWLTRYRVQLLDLSIGFDVQVNIKVLI